MTCEWKKLNCFLRSKFSNMSISNPSPSWPKLCTQLKQQYYRSYRSVNQPTITITSTAVGKKKGKKKKKTHEIHHFVLEGQKAAIEIGGYLQKNVLLHI